MSPISRTRRERPMLVLNSLEDCDALAGLALFAHPWREVSVQIAGFDDVTRKSTEQRLNRLYKECGCRLGALSTVLAIAVVVCGRTYGWALDFNGAVRVLAEVTFVVAAAAIGKLLGLIHARQALCRYVAGFSRSGAANR